MTAELCLQFCSWMDECTGGKSIPTALQPGCYCAGSDFKLLIHSFSIVHGKGVETEMSELCEQNIETPGASATGT